MVADLSFYVPVIDYSAIRHGYLTAVTGDMHRTVHPLTNTAFIGTFSISEDLSA